MSYEEWLIPNPIVEQRKIEPLYKTNGYVLRLRDMGPNQSAILWRGVSLGEPAPYDYPTILAVQIEKDVATVVFNHRRNCWGDITRWKSGAEPERLFLRSRVYSPEWADFGEAAEQATVAGSYFEKSLTVTVSNAQRAERTYEPTFHVDGDRWKLRTN